MNKTLCTTTFACTYYDLTVVSSSQRICNECIGWHQSCCVTCRHMDSFFSRIAFLDQGIEPTETCPHSIGIFHPLINSHTRPCSQNTHPMNPLWPVTGCCCISIWLGFKTNSRASSTRPGSHLSRFAALNIRVSSDLATHWLEIRTRDKQDTIHLLDACRQL